MASSKQLPRMYYKNDKDRDQVRQADFMTEASADPFESADYKETESVEPAKSLKTTRLRKKGMPDVSMRSTDPMKKGM